MQTAGGDLGEARHRAINAVAEPFAAWVEVVKPLAGHRAIRIDHRRGFAHRPIPFLPRQHPLALLADDAGELVAEHDGVVDRPGMVGRPLVQIAPAHADRRHFQQHIVRADDRAGDVTQFDRALFGA